MTAVSVPGYEIGDTLGSSVYRAGPAGTDRAVAIKVGTHPLADDARGQFERDARRARELSAHPHVVELRDFGVLPDSRPYLVMELCAGPAFGDRPVSPREVAEIGQQLADVLATAHDLGLRHGAVAPDKVLRKQDGTVGLTGFGLTQAPETDDIRALGETLDAVLGGQAAPAELTEVLRRARENDFPDAAALRAELSQLVVDTTFSGSTPPVQVSAASAASAASAEAAASAGSAAKRTASAGSAAIDASAGSSAEPAASAASAASASSAASPASGASAGRRRALVWVGVVLVVLLVVAGVIYFIADPGADDSTADSPSGAAGGRTPPSAGALGAPTVTDDCPAAGVERGQAQCVAEPECWGNDQRPLPCDQHHVAETFAIAPVPKGINDPSLEVLTAHPVVREVCSNETLLASRFGAGKDYSADSFTASVLPPTLEDKAVGRSVYRCLGTVTGLTGVTGSLFRP